MNITESTFNRIVTVSLMVYIMFMYSWSQFTGHTLNLESFITFLAPILTHVVHIVDNKTLSSDQKVQVQNDSTTNSN